MIDFDCPACAEPMEISDRMAGKQVRCPYCAETVEVTELDRRKRRKRRKDPGPGLSPSEWLVYTLIFMFVPAVNVLASSILYYVWRNDKPRKATQINLLGFLVFGFHVFIYIMYVILIAKK